MNFEYIGFGDLNEIKVGQTREDLIAKLGGKNIQRFKKNENDSSLSDYFQDYGLFVYYDKDYISEAFEFDEDGEVIFEGRNIVGRKIGDLLEELEKKDSNLVKDFSGFISFKYGISGYTAESSKEHDISFDAILFFKKGYVLNSF